MTARGVVGAAWVLLRAQLAPAALAMPAGLAMPVVPVVLILLAVLVPGAAAQGLDAAPPVAPAPASAADAPGVGNDTAGPAIPAGPGTGQEPLDQEPLDQEPLDQGRPVASQGVAPDGSAPEVDAAEPTVVPPSTAPDAASELSGADDDAYELSAGELAELGFATAEDGTVEVDDSLQIYGFIDAGLQANFLGKQLRTLLGPETKFLVGNVNLYVTKQITETVRSMLEVRFLFLPNGAGDLELGNGDRTDTSAEDYGDFQRPLKWGGIEIERVYLEWFPWPFLGVRVGMFLTPYGIWNVDHGSPTIIAPERPFPIGNAYFPERQTGLELLGRTEISSHEALGYHLTLSNGTGPIAEYDDFDKNKAVGARLFVESRRVGELRVGGSAYYGRHTERQGGGVRLTPYEITTQYDNLATAFDLLFKLDRLHVQGEWIHRQRAYTKEGRAETADGLTGRAIPADRLAWGAYGLVGYRLPWLEIMPYVVGSMTRGDSIIGQMEFDGYQVGLNIRPLPEVVLKLEYSGGIVDLPGIGELSARRLLGQVAWAF